MSSGVILLQRPYIAFSSPLLLILRREITAAAVALFFLNLAYDLVSCIYDLVYRIFELGSCIRLIISKHVQIITLYQ